VAIISNNINNIHNNIVTIVPIASNTNMIYSFEVLLPKGIANLPKDSKAKADQIRTIDKSRLIKSIGVLPNDYMIKIEKAIKLHLDL